MREPFPPWGLFLAAAVVAAVTLLPLLYLMIRAAESGSNLWPLISRPRTFQVLTNSALLAAAVTATTIAIALPTAWLLERTDLPGRRFFRVLTAVPLTIPSLVGAYAFLAAFGRGGLFYTWAQAHLGIELGDLAYGFTGSWIVLSLLTYPYVLLPIGSTLRALDASQEEAAKSLGHTPMSLFRKLVVPHLSPAILSGGLLVSLYTLSDFAAVSLLQYDSFTRVIYVQYQSSFNRSYAAVLALLLVALAGAILGVEGKVRVKGVHFRVGTGSKRPPRPIALGPWRWPATLALSSLGLGAVGLPVGVTAYWIVEGLLHGGAVAIRWSDASNAFLVSLGAAVITVLAALPIGLISVRYRSGWTRWVEKATYLSHGLPGVVVALSLVFFGARYGGPLYQTVWMLLLAYTVLFLPQSLAAVRASLLHVSPNVENVARSLGHSPLQVWWRVTLPLIRPGMLSGGALVFLTAMKELPAALLLSPPGFRTLATSIWGAVSEGFYARAAAPALILVAISSLSLAFLLREGKSRH